MQSFILVNNVKLPVDASHTEAFSVAKRVMKNSGLLSFVNGYSIFKRSVDARHKPEIYFVYSVAVHGSFPEISEKTQNKFGFSVQNSVSDPTIVIGNQALSAPPVVVGSGPAGLFAALVLAENGYNPIILERGGSVEDRKIATEVFNSNHILDTETNIQFGAGGAGTFSDGKLVTRISDPLTSYVIEKLIEFGAPEETRYIAKPHIGTDILSVVVSKVIDRICELGGSILYHTKFISAVTENGTVNSIKTSKGDIKCGALILATGHSARDTYKSLLDANFSIEAKPFSVGMRIEHLANDIDYALYGEGAKSPNLGRAEYSLSHNTKQRGTYTFCMCPGGLVVAAASEEGGLVVNGMSYHARSGLNSNSAVVTSIFPSDYGNTPHLAIEYQRNIERQAFLAGGGEYSAPIITVGDFLSDKCSTEPSKIIPTYMSGSNVKIARPENYLPDFVCSEIKSALSAFDRKISGFACKDAILTGAETRTSAPVRILRNQDTKLALGYSNIFPSGEGAGYAGGITSAGVDGVKSALALMKIYKPNK